MTRKTSFTRLENDVLPTFRESMARAESTADVRKFFVYTLLELCNGAVAGRQELAYEDFALTPGVAPGYALSARLREHPVMAELLRDSDLAAIVERFAQAAGNRFKRLEKHPARTEAKIHHGTGGPARA